MPPPETVLLVEDDLIDVMSIRRIFRDIPLDNPLVVVSNAEQALTYLRDPAQPRPGLILLDLNMPRMNGLEFLAAVQHDPALRSVPVVILSTSDHEDDHRQAREYSAAYILKSLDYAQFLSDIRQLFVDWRASR
ncbi:MAG: response regulator [Chloroflexi bacterium]|nr:response regulator [Chloroflexota bacterium]